MLLHLHVKNLALIRETEIDFTEGLNILTGETGAGKSIIIGSITMALGGKVSREMLREDADHALIELIFSIDQPVLLNKLNELDIPVEDGLLILSRKISGSRSICRLNGVTVGAATLREVSSCLIDIHGQHEHQSLLNKKKHLEVLDDFCGAELWSVKDELQKAYKTCQNLKKELEAVSMDESSRMREQSLLEFEVQEIEDAALKHGEDMELEASYRRMVNGKKIMESMVLVKELLAGDASSASDQTGRACRELSGAVRYDGELENLNHQLQEIDSMLADFTRELDDYMERMEFSEEEFYSTEERLNLVNHLKAKYGSTIGAIQEAYEEKQKRLDVLLNFEQHQEKLRKDFREAESRLEEQCLKAHEIRVKNAQQLASLMRQQLEELNFLDVRFEVSVSKLDHPMADGWDDVEFLISTNPGEPLKALGKIASGGELSRVMLAIKTVLADRDEIDTVIFDEIDAGISGRTAQKVSEKLSIIGRSRQVICITHLAQLAAMADSHYCIEKRAVDGMTQTGIRKLQPEEVTEELARILGGAVITDAVRDNAREMKKLAQQFKQV